MALSDAFLILDKPLGMSSQQAVTAVRKALQAKKAGHTGTLDPLATGVLPIAFGEATKVIPYLEESEKVYEVEGRLGATTTTDDAEGEILEAFPIPDIDSARIVSALEKFLGKSEQVPPCYSAIKVKGQPLYRYARNGMTPELKPRPVEIFQLQLLAWGPPFFRLRVVCSKGTYVRSLVRDLGAALGSGAHVTQLIRLRSGPFARERALTLEQISAAPDGVETSLFSIEDCLAHLPRIDLISRDEVERTERGQCLHRVGTRLQAGVVAVPNVLLEHGGQVVAVIHPLGGGTYGFGRVLNRKFPFN